jgi:hypothetical protein
VSIPYIAITETIGEKTLFRWSKAQRLGVFVLSASSIVCLLTEFYGFCPMRIFTLAVFLPCLAGLTLWSGVDRRLLFPVLFGAGCGLLAALAYDVFRLPFVFSNQWGLKGIVPHLKLFNAFPAFGAMILGEPYPRGSYSRAEHLLGWLYHFSNAVSFGVMYVAAVGDPRVRHWIWAVVMAVGLEIGMLATPYTRALGIPLTVTFVYVTLAAHLIFGVVLGLSSSKWRLPTLRAV